jgi:NAD(P)-dependent dehydrogenase (short-subunit alcohol dehydrogenase family)
MTAIDKFKLDGKTVVVTGGGRGIGYAVAEFSASVGADVAVIDILEEVGVDEARRLAASSGCEVNFYRADLRQPHDVAEVAARIEADFGRVDVLFNCIGVNPNTPVLDIPAEEWRSVMDVNVNGQFYAAQAFASRWRATAVVASSRSARTPV